MTKVYKSAKGKPIDMDHMRLANEGVIAVGNMRTNARGDQLGPGGKVVKPRNEIIKDYHRMNTPVADDAPVYSNPKTTAPAKKLATPIPDDLTVTANSAEEPAATAPKESSKPRGSLADAVAAGAEVNQELLKPVTKSEPGIKRI